MYTQLTSVKQAFIQVTCFKSYHVPVLMLSPCCVKIKHNILGVNFGSYVDNRCKRSYPEVKDISCKYYAALSNSKHLHSLLCE
jgi:hypothetical protein